MDHYGNMMSNNKTLVVTGYGGYDKMAVVDRPRPTISSTQILVNVRATGINFAELMARQGVYNRIPPLPAVLGFEGAGVVMEVGSDVKDKRVGDRVVCVQNFGLWTEYAAVEDTNSFVMPEKMTFEEGAALMVNYITAYHMLFEMAGLRRGQSVLVQMVAGGVGVAATQLIKTVPDTVVFGTCSGAKHDMVRKFGVDHPIDYRTQDYVAEIRKIDPKGVNIVLDPLSGSDSKKAWALLKPLGKVIHFGAANTVSGPSRSIWNLASTYFTTHSVNALSIMTQNKVMGGYHLGYLWEHPEVVIEAVKDLLKLYEEGKIQPQIDSVWGYEDVGLAMARMHDRKNIGKVVLCPQREKGSGEIRNTVL